MKKVIIFGATGGVGAYVATGLKDYEVVAVGRRQDNGFFASNDIEYRRMDVLNSDLFKYLPSDAHTVINLSGILPAKMEGYNPERYIDNIRGQMNILEYAHGCDRVIFAQSISDVIHLYGGMIPEGVTNRFPLNNDHSVYSICKNASVNLMEHYSAKYGYQWAAIRMPHIYMYHPDPYFFVNGIRKKQHHREMIERAVRGEEIKIWGDPSKRRDMIYVKDLVNQIRVLIEGEVSGMYNAGTGAGTSLEDQVRGIVEVFGGSVGYEPENEYLHAEYIMDISRSRLLGYEPRYDYLSYLRDFKIEMEQNRFEKLWGRPLQ